MKQHIGIYNQFDTIVVPFPFTDKAQAKRRPALVLSKSDYQQATQHLILCMITSAKNSAWPNDLAIEDKVAAGIEHPSIIRFKLFTLDERLILHKVGQLADRDKARVKKILVNSL